MTVHHVKVRTCDGKLLWQSCKLLNDDHDKNRASVWLLLGLDGSGPPAEGRRRSGLAHV